MGGGGALFYCAAVDIALIKETKAMFPFRLQSKHVVCSHIHLQPVIECLKEDGSDDGHGVVAMGRARREEFLKKRASQVSEYYIIELPACVTVDLSDITAEHVTDDLRDFLDGPPMVQCLAYEAWQEEVWTEVAKGEPALVAISSSGERRVPICQLCGETIHLRHLIAGPCACVLPQRARPGTLFQAILSAVAAHRPCAYRAVKRWRL